MCVFVCALYLFPSNTCWGLRCVCSGTGLASTLPFLVAVLECVCLSARSACTPPFLAGVCSLCLWVRVFAPTRQSWLGFVVCVSELKFCSHLANPGWGVGLCMSMCALCLWPANPGWCVRCLCLCTGFRFTSANLAGVFGVLVCVRILFSACQSWLGCFGACVSVCALPVHRQSWLGPAVFLLGYGFSPHRANPGWGLWCVCMGSRFDGWG